MDPLLKALFAKWLIQYEDWRNDPYNDGSNNPTIGVGFNMNGQGSFSNAQQIMLQFGISLITSQNLYQYRGTITDQQVKALLDYSMNQAIQNCQSIFGANWNITDPNNPLYINDARKLALADMMFNTGVTSFRGFRNLIADVLSGNWSGAANEAKYTNGVNGAHTDFYNNQQGNVDPNGNTKGGRANADIHALESGQLYPQSLQLDTAIKRQKYNENYRTGTNGGGTRILGSWDWNLGYNYNPNTDLWDSWLNESPWDWDNSNQGSVSNGDEDPDNPDEDNPNVEPPNTDGYAAGPGGYDYGDNSEGAYTGGNGGGGGGGGGLTGSYDPWFSGNDGYGDWGGIDASSNAGWGGGANAGSGGAAGGGGLGNSSGDATADENFGDDGFDQTDATRDNVHNLHAGSCFVAGTPVATPNGYAAIELLNKGDKVYAYDTNSKQVVTETVAETFIASKEDLAVLTLGTEVIRCTRRHRFYTGEWTAAEELTIGQKILSKDGQWLALDARSFETVSQNVYNVTVTNVHNYFVGTLSLLVHNYKKDQSSSGPEISTNGGSSTGSLNNNGQGLPLSGSVKGGRSTISETSNPLGIEVSTQGNLQNGVPLIIQNVLRNDLQTNFRNNIVSKVRKKNSSTSDNWG